MEAITQLYLFMAGLVGVATIPLFFFWDRIRKFLEKLSYKPDNKLAGFGAKIIMTTLDGQKLMELECGGKSLKQSIEGIRELKKVAEGLKQKKEKIPPGVG